MAQIKLVSAATDMSLCAVRTVNQVQRLGHQLLSFTVRQGIHRRLVLSYDRHPVGFFAKLRFGSDRPCSLPGFGCSRRFIHVRFTLNQRTFIANLRQFYFTVLTSGLRAWMRTSSRSPDSIGPTPAG